MATITVEKKKYTYEDYLKTPDDKRYELIYGELLLTPAPVPRHQLIAGRLECKLREHVMKHNLGEIYDAPCDVFFDDENVVQPDYYPYLRTGCISSAKKTYSARPIL